MAYKTDSETTKSFTLSDKLTSIIMIWMATIVFFLMQEQMLPGASLVPSQQKPITSWIALVSLFLMADTCLAFQEKWSQATRTRAKSPNYLSKNTWLVATSVTFIELRCHSIRAWQHKVVNWSSRDAFFQLSWAAGLSLSYFEENCRHILIIAHLLNKDIGLFAYSVVIKPVLHQAAHLGYQFF